MAGHQLINAYRAELALCLPPDIVDKLAEGLDEAFHHHISGSSDLSVDELLGLVSVALRE
jgi:hypothetical protein